MTGKRMYPSAAAVAAVKQLPGASRQHDGTADEGQQQMISKRMYPTTTGEAVAAPPRLCKIREAAETRGLDVGFVRRLVERRAIPSWKVGPKYRMINPDDLDRFIAAGYTPAEGVS